MFSTVLLILIAFNNAERPRLVRRLLSYADECKIMEANTPAANGLPANPTSIDVAIIFKEDDTHLQKMDFDTSSNNDVDMDTAREWCQARFGLASKPVAAIDQNYYDLLDNIRSRYKNNTFFGLVRKMGVRTDTISDCDEWKDYDGNTYASSDSQLAGHWHSTANTVQPVCKDNFDTEHARYDSGNKKQCVVYKHQDDGLFAYRCDFKAIIVCTWHDDKCDTAF